MDSKTIRAKHKEFMIPAVANYYKESLPLTADITVRSVEIELPAIDTVVAELVRGHDVRSAPIQIYRGERE